MQNTFVTFFQLGIKHIADREAIDHIVFLLALCAPFSIREGRQITILITAFTIGHSITLALAALNIITPWYNVVEKLIPVTIMCTALVNCYRINKQPTENVAKSNFTYILALAFGCFHGMGFSNMFRQLQSEGDNLVAQLFAFNLGIEAGQICIVLLILTVSFSMQWFFKVAQRAWVYFISGVAFGIGTMLFLK